MSEPLFQVVEGLDLMKQAMRRVSRDAKNVVLEFSILWFAARRAAHHGVESRESRLMGLGAGECYANDTIEGAAFHALDVDV